MTMSPFNHLDYVAVAIGTLGTVFWAHNGSWARYAAILWLVSSLFWIFYAWLNGLPALGLRDLVSVSMYVYGGWRWLRPKQSNS